MYVNKNTLKEVNDNAPYTSTNGTKYPRNYPKDEIAELAQVTLTDRPDIDNATQKITGYTIDETYMQVWAVESKATEEVTSYKQSLLDSIEPLQQKVFSKNSDVLAIKFQDSENDDDLTNEEKKANNDLNKKVIKWRKKVRQQNNNITIDNTLEEIQARIDRINELDELFPEVE